MLANLYLIRETIQEIQNFYNGFELSADEICVYTYNAIDWYIHTDETEAERLCYLAIAGSYDDFKPHNRQELEDIILDVVTGGEVDEIVYYLDKALKEDWEEDIYD